ncbi:MAG: DUF4139 domain-containing protein [Bacteroidales bacterium]
MSLFSDSLKVLNDMLTNLQDELDAYEVEKQVLYKNQQSLSNDNSMSITELGQKADFYRNRFIDINKIVSKIKQEQEFYKKLISKISNQLNALNHKSNYVRSEVVILVSAKNEITTEVTLKYMVSDAGWLPGYDIKAEEIDQPITLIYRAKIFNATEIDWTNTLITLSTADPTKDASKPKLSPWYLNYKNDLNTKSYNVNLFNEVAQDASQKQGDQDTILYGYVNVNQNDGKLIQMSELSNEFKIETQYSIPATANPYFVDIDTYTLSTSYIHFTAPKKDKGAYLIARITGWEDLSLVPGFANIYFNDTYVGQSLINSVSINDTLDISLGRDNKVQVNRIKQKEYSSNQFIGSNRKETFTYEIVIKNNRSNPVKLAVLDQIPISQDSEIEVNAIDISGATFNEIDGSVKWELKVEPGTNENVNLSYSIKFPKSKPISTQKYSFKNSRFL